MPSLRDSCEAVLRGNDRGDYTVPAPKLYPHQWAWDSAFAAIGWAYIDAARAWRELHTLMASQWDDGRIPHITFHIQSDEYFPGPDFWGTERSSSITQPPIWATCARRILEITDTPPTELKSLVQKIEASHVFFAEHRDPKDYHAVAVVHPWESGLDNCPAWDGPLSRVDVSDPPEFQRRDKEATGDASVRPTDDQYLRYACLVKAIAEDGFGPGPFAVYDPLMTSVLVRAEEDLSWLANRAGVKTVAKSASRRASLLRGGLQEHLWSDDHGRYLYIDAVADERIESDVIGCYAPLFCGVDGDRGEKLRSGLIDRYNARYPFPSTAPSDPDFEPRRYWRGPTWINVDWMLLGAMPKVADKVLALVEKSGCREYYHPETGEGLGAEDFAWTAALALDLLARRDKK